MLSGRTTLDLQAPWRISRAMSLDVRLLDVADAACAPARVNAGLRRRTSPRGKS